MRQYLLSVRMVEGSQIPSPDEVQDALKKVDELNSELQESGASIFAGGLLPPFAANVLQVQGDDVVTHNGPFIKGGVHLSGVWVIKASDNDAALEWAAKATRACGQPVEVRPFQEMPED